MLNRGREGLFELGQQLQQQGEYQAALHCFLSCLLGLSHVQTFTSLPNCLHQIAELFITEKNYGKALQFIQAEKMFYEVALIELTALHGSTGPQEEATLGSAGWTTPEELSEQASHAQHLERLAQLCIMSKQPHLALEYSGKATKIHQRAFGNDHPITARSLELMATVYAEIGKNEYSDSLGQCVSALSKRFAAAESIRDTVNCVPHSHREKHSEVRHRKDSRHHPEDTPKPKIANGKVPTSILKRPSPNYGSDAELNHRRKGERRVRFREPETTVHGENIKLQFAQSLSHVFVQPEKLHCPQQLQHFSQTGPVTEYNPRCTYRCLLSESDVCFLKLPPTVQRHAKWG
ncbi:nutritionally-regulated adipose and cardiac enriched protein homolog isoform X1 [Pleuronectes platessa]|uniref:nutritionally-regulated adipose and cardiac enriched protein homolog isoform X1 n=1 Tax=Pleuronectes platessa TaxID=8262 RepID=UPI00232A5947|nr:nutritionally-regulated adipose and cardiac enriched protein homolog isoform X1 [Pleuronectes platessa]